MEAQHVGNASQGLSALRSATCQTVNWKDCEHPGANRAVANKA
jgi:hypothetical protein